MTDDETPDDRRRPRSTCSGGPSTTSEPIPDGARQAALDAFAFRDLDAELAELVEEESFATTRGDATARWCSPRPTPRSSSTAPGPTPSAS